MTVRELWYAFLDTRIEFAPIDGLALGAMIGIILAIGVATFISIWRMSK